MRVSVFGLGYVGAVTSGCFARNGFEVIGVDRDPHKLDRIRDGKAPIVEEGVDDLIGNAVSSGKLRVTDDHADAVQNSDVSIVCVGTPSAPDGSLGTEAIIGVSKQIGDALRTVDRHHSVVVRSTVLPGTTANIVTPLLEQHSGKQSGDGLGVSMNPEFLREGTSIADFDDPPFTVIGSAHPEECDRIAKLYKGVPGEIVKCGLNEAEAIKYTCNLWHAVKITFANEIGAVFGSAGVDPVEVMRIACLDEKLNISNKYMRPGFAFGGSCLPKDLRAFLYLARAGNTMPSMMDGVLKSNRDLIERTAKKVTELGKRRISMLGISFKEGTDDLRESPLVDLAEILIGKGYDVKIFDPNVNYAALFGSNRRHIERNLPHLRSALCSAEVAGEHAEVLILGHNDAVYQTAIDHAAPSAEAIDLVRFSGNVPFTVHDLHHPAAERQPVNA